MFGEDGGREDGSGGVLGLELGQSSSSFGWDDCCDTKIVTE